MKKSKTNTKNSISKFFRSWTKKCFNKFKQTNKSIFKKQTNKSILCNICDSEIEEDNGDVVGNFGICPVSFCVWCLSSMTDMVIQLNGFDNIETLEEKISELKEDKEYELESCP